MLKIAESITSNKEAAKNALTATANRFWQEKKEIWRQRCDTFIKWEKQNNITKKLKRAKNNNPRKPTKKYNKTTDNPINLEKSINTNFENVYIEVTNFAMNNFLLNN